MKEFWGRLGTLPEVGKRTTLTEQLMLRKPGFMTDVYRGWKDAGELSIARLRRRALEMGCPEEKLAPGFQERVIEFTGSDETVDRMGDIIKVDGWELDDFRRNPVFMPWHDYHAPPVGQALDVFIDQERAKKPRRPKKDADNPAVRSRLRFIILFATEQENPLAETMFQLFQGGFMRATSVGFRPKQVKRPTDEEREALGMGALGVIFEKQELLELSGVSIPANPNALMEAGMVLDEENAKELTLLADRADAVDHDFAYALRSIVKPSPTTADLGADGKLKPSAWDDVKTAFEGVAKFIEGDWLTEGLSPRDVSQTLAPRGTPWSAPTLLSFTDDDWDDLTTAQKRRIAGHFAWADASPASSFGQLKLPHHRSADGYVVFRGIVAAAGRFNQTSMPAADRPAVRSHLRHHYGQFDEEPPAVLQESVPGDKLPQIRALMAREALESFSVPELQELAGLEPKDDVFAGSEMDKLVGDISWLWDDEKAAELDAADEAEAAAGEPAAEPEGDPQDPPVEPPVEDPPAADPAATDPPAEDPAATTDPPAPEPQGDGDPEPPTEPPAETDPPAPAPEPIEAETDDDPVPEPEPCLLDVEPWVASALQMLRSSVQGLIRIRGDNRDNVELRHAAELGLHTVLHELGAVRQEIKDAVPERDLESAEDLDADNFRQALDDLQKQAFTVQAFKFPRRIWKHAEAVKQFAEAQGLIENEIKGDGGFFVLTQREPRVFSSTRDVCVSPGGADAAGASCRIIATGGALKSAELLELEKITERITQLEDRVNREGGQRLTPAPRRANGSGSGHESDLYSEVLDVSQKLRTKATAVVSREED